jgi:copper(I)-binding protein
MTSRSRLGSGFLQRAGRGASLLLVGFLSVQVAQAAVTGPDVAVTGGQMRVLLPSRPAAGYFTLENHGGSALVLSGASAPDCQSLMLHQSTEDGGMARMAMVTSVPVPPHGMVRFAPGGYHLMCMQPSGALLTHAGSETVTLHFADGGSVSAPFAIQGIGH